MLKPSNIIDLTGQVFGKLTVLHRVKLKHPTSRHATWKCRCECGNEVVVQGRLLRNGATISCGCTSKTKKERSKMYAKDMEKTSASLERLLEYDCGDPYQNLASAIVAVAADEYRSALKSGNKTIQKKLEKFFSSSWCGLLTGLDCVSLCENLRREDQECPEVVYV